MNNSQPYIPYLVLAVICGVASVAIVFISMMVLGHNGGVISDTGMYGIAAMAAAPAVMGIGIARFMGGDKQ